MSDKDSSFFLEHILENIEMIEQFSKGLTKEQLLKNKQKQYAIARAIEIIGEAVRNIPESFKNKYPNIPWKEVVGTRDKLIHHYFGIDLDIVWKIICEDIPILKREITEILDDME